MSQHNFNVSQHFSFAIVDFVSQFIEKQLNKFYNCYLAVTWVKFCTTKTKIALFSKLLHLYKAARLMVIRTLSFFCDIV